MTRSGSATIAMISLVVLAVLIALAMRLTSDPRPLSETASVAQQPLIVHCAAGLRAPMTEIAAAYERATGVPVSLQFGGSKAILGSLELQVPADLAVIADRNTVERAHSKQLIREILPLAEQRVVLAVHDGNPLQIRSLEDLLRPGLRFGLVDPNTASLGAVLQERLSVDGRWEALRAAAAVTKPTVNDVAADLQIGHIDVAVLWDGTVATANRAAEADPQLKRFLAIPLSEFADVEEPVSIVIASGTQRPTRALHFARWASARDRGAPIVRRHGFSALGGDVWAERPELIVYSGTVNRLAISPALAAFQEREGVRITEKFNGCGVLTADMRDLVRSAGPDGPRLPDVYYTCDGAYIGPVVELFPEARPMSETDVIMAVPSGNPAGIASLNDLARPGVRVGVSHAQQSTLGWLTRRLLREAGVLEAVRPNIVVENPQADFLMNHLKAGHLDVVIVYQVSVRAHPLGVDIVAIDHPAARAVQTWSASRSTEHPLLVERLRLALHADKARYESMGLRWLDDAPQASAAWVVPGGPGSE